IPRRIGDGRMAADLSPRSKPRLNVGLIGHLEHGKSMLAAALAARAASHNALHDFPTYQQIVGQGAERDEWRTVSLELRYADVETPARHYTLIDCPGHPNFLKNTITGLGLMDAAILVVSAYEGVGPGTRQHLMLANALGVRDLVVFLCHTDLV